MDEEWENLLRKEISSAAVKSSPEPLRSDQNNLKQSWLSPGPLTGSSTDQQIASPRPTTPTPPDKRSIPPRRNILAQAAIEIDEAVVDVWREGPRNTLIP
jgi:hypothetical protein